MLSTDTSDAGELGLPLIASMERAHAGGGGDEEMGCLGGYGDVSVKRRGSRRSVEDEIRLVREAVRTSRTRFGTRERHHPTRSREQNVCNSAKPTRGLGPGTPSLRGKDK